MITKAREQGNSIEINIPLNVAEKYGIVNGSIIEIEEKEDGIYFKPIEKNSSVNELLAQVTDKNKHKEYFNKPMGKELL